MKSKIGINSKFFRPQQYAHKDPRPELPFEKSNENVSLLQFVVYEAGRASPASASVTAPDYRIADRGFRWDAETRQHIPQLLIEFAPVPANDPNDSKGWKDRDSLAAMLAAAPATPVSEDKDKIIAAANALENIASTSSSTRIRRVANDALTAIRARRN